MTTRLALLLVVPVLLAACGDDAADVPAPAGDGATTPSTIAPPDREPDVTRPGGLDVAGAWRLVVGEIDDAPVALVSGWDVTMTIEGDRIGGTAACNGYGGTVEHDPEDGSFAVGELSRTEMACEPAVMELESAFLAGLGSVTEAAVDDAGGLSLIGPSSTWYFEPLPPVPTADIVGTTWVLDTYVDGDAATNVPGMEDATLTLAADGTLTGSTGCRDLSGRWIESGSEILFTEFAADGECSPELQELDNWVVSVLGDGFTAEVDGDRLTVTSQGAEGLSYTAAP